MFCNFLRRPIDALISPEWNVNNSGFQSLPANYNTAESRGLGGAPFVILTVFLWVIPEMLAGFFGGAASQSIPDGVSRADKSVDTAQEDAYAFEASVEPIPVVLIRYELMRICHF